MSTYGQIPPELPPGVDWLIKITYCLYALMIVILVVVVVVAES